MKHDCSALYRVDGGLSKENEMQDLSVVVFTFEGMMWTFLWVLVQGSIILAVRVYELNSLCGLLMTAKMHTHPTKKEKKKKKERETTHFTWGV